MRWKRSMSGRLAVALATCVLSGVGMQARGVEVPAPAVILEEMKSFRAMASVLMIAAHPDDENTQLIAYLARGREYRMAYLSVTRGDGGQNLLGADFGEELGLIRTHELLAARELDMGRQFFTRAIDFGFSKRADETLRIWDREAVLGDVVRVIRMFRPDVIVTRFNPDIPGGVGTHGHHTASAILGREAFKLAADANAYPEQLKPEGGGLSVWQAKRILLNTGAGGGRGTGAVVTIDAGGMDPVLNESYSSIASRSRAMHKTQGFGAGGVLAGRGGQVGPSPQAFTLLGGDAATTDIMDGINTTWGRVPGGAEVAKLIDEAIGKFDAKDTAASVPALLGIKKLVNALPADPIVTEKRHLLDRLIADCLGLSVETTIPNAQVVPGETLKLHSVASMHSSANVLWTTIFPSSQNAEQPTAVDLSANMQAIRDVTESLAKDNSVSQPYWLREAPAPGIYHVTDAKLIGQSTNPPVFPIWQIFLVDGEPIVLFDEPVQVVAGAPAPQARRPLEVIAPVSVAFLSEVRLFTGGAAKSVDVEVTGCRANAVGTVALNVPAGWKAAPESVAFKLGAAGDHAKVSFMVTPGGAAKAGEIGATATVGGKTFTTSRKEINYPHIPVLLLQPSARIRAVPIDLAIRGKTIGYIAGAGDSVAECIEQMGYTVKMLKGADLTDEGLKRLDAVVFGVRAYNVRGNELSAGMAALTRFAQAGGTVISQYNRQDGQGNGTQVGPLNVHISALRVTDENAKMSFLVPEHPVLNVPNKITDADFDGWVQERSIYLPDTWDEKFTAVLGTTDPGETPPNSGLLIAPVGKGYVVYTSLVFFRELPAGNAGSYRLFANMLSLGKK